MTELMIANASTCPPPHHSSFHGISTKLTCQISSFLISIRHMRSQRCCSQTSISAKLSVSLLRHTDLVPADRAFYEAGLACRVSLSWHFSQKVSSPLTRFAPCTHPAGGRLGKHGLHLSQPLPGRVWREGSSRKRRKTFARCKKK